MTAERAAELRAELAEGTAAFYRAERDRKLRAGVVTPRNRREFAVAREGLRQRHALDDDEVL